MMDKKITQNLKKALLVGFYLKSEESVECAESLEELERLAETYGLKVIDKVAVGLRKINAATIIGSGKLQELEALSDEFSANVIIFDNEISPHQGRNLEKVFKKPVLDRTELIIEVFAQRAQTKEASLQVELAKIRYQLPRLKRLWTHLSRQVSGGGGYLKGEGEKQIELDRRMLHHRIFRLQKEIENVRANRKIQRSKRQRNNIPTFAIVGYTNSGKSTLLQALTNANILVEDKLFATLDTTTRKFTLPNNQEILLIDTVGFIRKISTTLIAAFKSTLEEAIYTDVLLHVIDASNLHALEQAKVTLEILKELGVSHQPVLTVLNKVDQCHENTILKKLKWTYPNSIEISAKNRQGFSNLTDAISKAITSLRKTVKLKIPQCRYSLVSELIKEGRVLVINYEGNDVLMEVEISSSMEKKVKSFIR